MTTRLAPPRCDHLFRATNCRVRQQRQGPMLMISTNLIPHNFDPHIWGKDTPLCGHVHIISEAVKLTY
jgi:hypothetical protein